MKTSQIIPGRIISNLTAVTEPFIADEGKHSGQTVIRVKDQDGKLSVILLEEFVQQKEKLPTRRGLNSKGRPTQVRGSDGSAFASIREMHRELGISFFAARKAVQSQSPISGVIYSEDDSAEN